MTRRHEPQSTSVNWIDAVVGYLIAWHGLGYAYAALPAAWRVVGGGYTWPVITHAWDAIVPLFCYFVLKRSFPIGGLRWRDLSGWTWPFLATLLIGVNGTLIAYSIAGKSMHSWLDYRVAGWMFEAFVPGVGEEFLFRGLVQTGLNQSIRWGFLVLGIEVKAGTLLTSLLFGLVHLGNLGTQPLAFTILQVSFAPLIGLAIGIGYDRTRNIWGAVLAHNASDLVDQALGLLLP
jgi:membrane protease YdiL (CAAX protease family)